MMTETRAITAPSRDELRYVDELPDQGVANVGWGPRLRRQYGYFLPDAYYEAIVARLVQPGCAWLDVGCGRDLFPHNAPLARLLSERAGRLVGVDPDPAIEENAYLHERYRQQVDALDIEGVFDVVTLRMVAEHLAEPDHAARAIARHTRQGGKLVIYTVFRWSPAAVTAWLTPFSWHHDIKRFLWRSAEQDTFPVAYRLNTRGALRRVLERAGFREAYFDLLDDCRTFARFRRLLKTELALWRLLRACRLRYPERCILAVYERA